MKKAFRAEAEVLDLEKRLIYYQRIFNEQSIALKERDIIIKKLHELLEKAGIASDFTIDDESEAIQSEHEQFEEDSGDIERAWNDDLIEELI
jgi:hypothetical protein